MIVPPKFVKPKYDPASTTVSVTQCPGAVVSPVVGVANCRRAFQISQIGYKCELKAVEV